jgi:hypothetical protein
MSGSTDVRGATAKGEALEAIVRRVTQEVWRELERQGITLPAAPATLPDGAMRIDMSRYRTPLLTERALTGLHPRAHTVVVPAGTIVTPRAKELLREKRIYIIYE